MNDWIINHTLSVEEIDKAYGWISGDTYWAQGIPRAIFDRSLKNSLVFALRDVGGSLRGIARVITDKATFAYLCDVFVCETVRGQGGGKALMDAIMAHPELQLLRRWMLATRDAHKLYARYGFALPEHPERLMVRAEPGLYARLNAQDP